MSTTIVDGLRKKVRAPVKAYFDKLAGRRLTKDGSEVPSAIPMAPPIGFHRQPTMVEHIRNMVRSEQLRQAAEAGGLETFEDADDFDVEDDPEPASRYEFPDDLEPVASLASKQASEPSQAPAPAEPASDGATPPAAPAAG